MSWHSSCQKAAAAGKTSLLTRARVGRGEAWEEANHLVCMVFKVCSKGRTWWWGMGGMVPYLMDGQSEART